MKLKIFLLLLLLTLPNLFANSQVFLNEGFETGEKPVGWTEQYFTGTEPWRYRNGGHSPNDNNWNIPPDEEDITRNPPSAHEGTYNAIFFKQSDANERTKLITKVIKMGGAIKPELTFWLCQVPWTFSGATSWDILRVYYKTSSGGSWSLLGEYLDPVEEWTECKINLPNPSDTYYIAFEAQTRWGFGCCIDGVVVEEKGIVNKWVSELKFAQPDLSFVPTGSDNIPIMRIDLKVYGNTGNAIFDSLVVKSLNTLDLDIKPDGVKLFSTTSSSFSSLNQIGTATDFVSRKATFESINYTLPTGQSYVWITYDIRDTATHGHYLDARIEAENLLINDTLYPPSSQSPPGSRIIYETIYHEDFEGTHNWVLQNDFEVNTPQGLGGNPGNPDPTNAYNGIKVMGTDLTGLLDNPGNYEPNSAKYSATSPSIDVFYFKNLKLSYKRHLNLEVWDTTSIEASVDNGVTWTKVWFEPNYYTDFEWTNSEHSVPASLARHANLKLRFNLGPTDGQDNYSGWNVDEVVITGDYIEKDAAVVEWVYPKTGCGHSSTDSVVVKIANLGAKDIPANMPVKYSFNGGVTWVTNYVTQIIPVGDTIEYVFSTKVDLSSPGLRSSVLAKTALSGDEATENDQVSTQVYIVPTYSLPFTATFEGNNGYWRSSGPVLWQWGTPAKATISSAGTGVGSWVTGLTDTYGAALTPDSILLFEDDFETNKGWVYTGEFERADLIMIGENIPNNTYSGFYIIGTDLTQQNSNPNLYENNIAEGSAYSATSPALNVSGYISIYVEFQRWLSIQSGDNVKFQVSDDNGTTWVTVWSNGGDEITDLDWTETVIGIPDSLSSTSQMKFRFILYSNASEVDEGWNIDDFKVYGKLFNTSPAYLQSPCINLTGVEFPIIDSKIFNHTEGGIDGATLYYSKDESDTWNHVNNSDSHDVYWNWYTDSLVTALGVNGWNGEDTLYKRTRHLLPGVLANQDSMIFRFTFKANKLNNNFDGIAFDDFKIYEAPYDVGVTTILSPVTSCDLSKEQSISVRIQNFGIRDMKTDDQIIIKINIDYDGAYGGFDESVTETKTLTGTFAAGATMDYTFTHKFDMSVTGTYNIESMTLIESDPFFYSVSANDTASAIIEVQKPHIELGSDYYTVRPDTVYLVATNPNAGITYNWYDDSDLITSIETNDSLLVPTIAGGEFWVTLTNAIPCTSVDSVTVHRLIADVGVIELASPDTSNCELSDETPFGVRIKNFGTDTLTAGDTLYLGYKFETGAKVDTNWVLSQTLFPGDTIPFTFDTLLDMSGAAPVTYDLKAWASVYYDNNHANDTLLEEVEVWGYPNFTAFNVNPLTNPDTVDVVDFKYEVDAGAGWTTYSWTDYPDSTGSTLTTYNTEWVKLTVYDTHNCPDNDSLFVDLTFTSIGVDSVITPVTACTYTTDVTPQFRIKNLGTVAVTAGKTIDYGYILNGSEIETGSKLLTGGLDPGDYILTELANPIDISAPGTYNFKFYAKANDFADPKAVDDTITSDVHVYGLPVLELGDDVYTRAANYVLDAGAGYDSYLWNTEETSQTITVDTSGLFSVDIVDNDICDASDNVNVTFLRHNYRITQLLSPVGACSSSQDKTVRVRYYNEGNDTLKAGQVVNFGYIINGGTKVTDDSTLFSNLTPGNYIDFTFTQKVDMQTSGTYNIAVFGIYAGDYNHSNDTLKNLSVVINPLPDVNLGADTIVRSGSITLDAGEGTGYTYTWQDDTHDQYLIATATGNYSVEVVDLNSCVEQDTIHVTSLTPDYGVIAISEPNTACTLSSAETVTITVKNLGTDTLYADSEIPVKLYVNSALRATETITLVDSLKPGYEIEYSFILAVDLSATGTYTIDAETQYADYSGDLNTTNDLFSKSVTVYGLPTVTHSNIDPLCEDSDPIALSGGSPAGGSYTGTGVTGTTFDPSVPGEGITTITYRVTDVHGCSNFANPVVHVYPLPTITFDAFGQVCENTATYELIEGNPEWGEYSGDHVSDGYFDPVEAGVGFHAITYSKTDTIYTYSLDTLYCSSSGSGNLEVQALPEVSITAPSILCIDAGLTALTGTPSGGIFSGDGVVASSNFSPSIAGVGPHTITYTYTNTTTNCTNTATHEITVYALPVVNLGVDQEICQGDSVTLDAGNSGSTFAWNTSATTQTVVAKTSGTYSVLVTTPQGCQSSDAMVLTVNTLPSVSMAALDPVCLNIPAYTLAEGYPYGGTYSGNGVSEDTIFTPSDAGAGDHTITYSYTDANECTDSVTQTLTVYPLPVVTFGGLTPVCEDAEEFALSTGSPTGGFYLGTGVSAGSFYPTVSGDGTFTLVYKYTDSNGCTDSTMQDMVVYPLPTINAGEDQTICNTQNVTLTATGTSTSYSWSGGITQGVAFTPTVTTTYTATGTIDSTGCQNSDDVTIIVNSLPSVNAGSDITICLGDSVTLTATGTANTYTWDNGVTQGVKFAPTTTTIFTVTGTIGSTGCENTDQVTVTVNPLPDVNAGDDVIVCEGEDVTLTATGADTYVWNNSVTQGVAFVPTSTSNYIVTGTLTTTGCQNTDTLTVSVNETPTVDAGEDFDICLGETVTLTATGTATDFTWDNGITQGIAFTPTSTTTYTVTGDFGGSSTCFSTDQVTITVNPVPNIDAGSDDIICLGDLVTLTATGNADTYTWNNGVIQSEAFAPGATTTYQVTGAFTSTGCESTDEVLITVNSLPTVSAGDDIVICQGESVTLTAEGDADSYSWDNGVADGVPFTPSSTTSYIVTGEDATTGCQTTDTLTVTVKPLQDATLEAIDPICSNNDPFTLSGGLPEGGTYKVDGVVSTTFNPSAEGPGTYTITYIHQEGNGCVDSASITLTVKDIPSATISTTDPLSYCSGDAIGTTYTAGPSGLVYQWLLGENPITSATAQTYTATAGGNYTVMVTGNGCTDTSSVSTITVNDLPNVQFTQLEDVCIDADPFNLSGGSPSGGTYSGTGVSDNSFDPAVAGTGDHTITYTYTDGTTGCTNIATSVITVNALPVVNLGNDQTITTPLVLDAGNVGSTYLWQDGSTGQTFTVNVTGEYSVAVTDGNGCVGRDTVNILFLKEKDIIISSLLSPVDKCYEESTSQVSVRLLNRGTKTYASGETIEVSYRIGSGTPVTETLAFTSSFPNNATLDFTFTQSAVLSTGTHLFTLYTIIESTAGEQFADNVVIHPLPDMEFGQDTIRLRSDQFPYVLASNNPGPGYLWNDGSTGASLLVTTYGSYWVEVTNEFGCTDRDTVVIDQPEAVEIIPGTNTVISLYPNPVVDELTIVIEADEPGLFDIDFINPQGQVISNYKTRLVTMYKNNINVNGFLPGIYLVKVSNDKGFAVFKVIVQK